MPSRIYQNTIWTNHALERLSDRRLTQYLAWKTFQHPDSSTKTKTGALQLKKRFDTFTVTVVATQNEKQEWIILSCWMDPPAKGSADEIKKQRYYEYKKAGVIKKIFMQISRQLFGKDF